MFGPSDDDSRCHRAILIVTTLWSCIEFGSQKLSINQKETSKRLVNTIKLKPRPDLNEMNKWSNISEFQSGIVLNLAFR